MKCHLCKNEADRKVTYNTNTLYLCSNCTLKLWQGEGVTQSLRNLVTSGLVTFIIEKL